MSVSRYAIIVAGGSGSRMGGETPKQFMLLKGMPVIYYSMQRFYEAGAAIVLVLPTAHLSLWEKLRQQHGINIPYQIAEGGSSRSHSVLNGLALIDETDALVAVHDAVRACVTTKLVNNLYEAALANGNAVPVVPLSDSIREVNGSINNFVNREHYVSVQTPQVFTSTALKTAFRNTNYSLYTDEASLMEVSGHAISLIKGEQTNFKITFSQDLRQAEWILDMQLSP